MKYEYYITPEGDKYRLNKKNEKILSKNNQEKRVQYGLTLENGEHKSRMVHHLQLWSYYPHLDWKPFCENLSKNGGINVSTIDHLLQDKNNKKCHYKYLEAVPHSENAKRNNIYDDKEKILKQSKTKGKSFTMTIDGKKVDKDFYSAGDAIRYLKLEYDINILNGSVSGCLLGTQTAAYNGRLKFNYTEKYKESQCDLPDEVWKTLEECIQKEEIKNKYKERKGRKPPKAISNKGRIKSFNGKITNGSQITNGSHSSYGVDISILVWLAFSETKIEDKLICHNDQHFSNTFDENGKVIRYSNWFETLRLGSHQENMKDMSMEYERKAKHNPNNEFIVRDQEGNEVMRSHFAPACKTDLSKKYPEIKFDLRHIYHCLRKERNSHHGFTFDKVNDT